MSPEDEEWIKSTIIEYERGKCISKVSSIDPAEPISEGANYISDISRLSVNYLDHLGQTGKRQAIYKTIPNSQFKMQNVKGLGLFTIESRMYQETLRLMAKLVRENEKNKEIFWPEFYGVRGHYDACLLEDLSPYGYKMPDRSWGGLDFHHSALALKKLAQFHAMGAVLLERGEIRRRDLLTRSFFFENQTQAERICSDSLAGLAETILTKWPKEWHSLAEGVKSLSDRLLPDIFNSFEDKDYSFETLNHGDLWFANILYKYNAEGAPTSLRFIDFQLVFVQSPSFDLQYYLNTSLRSEYMERRHELLLIYHEALTRGLQVHGFTGKSPSFEELLDDMRRTEAFGYLVALVLRPMMINPPIRELMEHFDVTERGKKWSLTHLCGTPEYLEGTRRTLDLARRAGLL